MLLLKLPGLTREASHKCKEISIPDVNFYCVKKKIIEENLFYHHYKDMKEEIEKSKQFQSIKYENFII